MEKRKDIQGAEITASIYSVLFANDAVSCVYFDLYQELKKSKIYKYDVKRLSNMIEAERISYENRLSEIVMASSTFLADVNDAMQEIISTDVLKMEISISNYLKKHKVENSDIIAKIEMNRMLAGFSCINISNQAKYLKSLNIKLEDGTEFDPFKMYSSLLLKRMFSLLEELCHTLYAKVANNVNLNESTEIKNGFRIIVKKLSDVNTIAFAIKTAQNVEQGVVSGVEEQKVVDKENEESDYIKKLKEHFNCKR